MSSFWAQKSITLRGKRRGCHLITDEILSAVNEELSSIRVGILYLFCAHTSCSLSLNENYDPDVRKDFEDGLNRIVPEEAKYRHTTEGRDDMPAHLKTSLVGSSHFIPISNGRLMLGTWQGIYFCEHRNSPSNREIVITINGST
ncbi:unnamed protein product [Blepharisma stoltei]|uniref:Secondary thiamine-phosphate synthase enzyme n=1 Tax=Blepharisma stoltei TaxID=1481888 RepID=A0AAU9IR47_9CILI|nr:unnamed protein product [Blepharisma stoltei]